MDRPIDDDEPYELWWDEEDDHWSEEAYWRGLADHFQEKHDELMNRVDCE